MRSCLYFAVVVAVVAPFCGLTAVQAEVVTVEANRLAEIVLTAEKEHEDPFNDVVLDVVFTTPKGEQVLVPAFWAGGRTWRLRYASPQLGEHRFRTVCSDADDKGLHGVSGKIDDSPVPGREPALPPRSHSRRRRP